MPFGTAPYVARKKNRRPVPSVPGLNRDPKAPGMGAGRGLMGYAAQRAKMSPGPGLKAKPAKRAAKVAAKGYRAAMKGKGA
ncbi:MAG: hypothetical protein ACREQL_09335 [Candidatus Binatia bacterium]